MLILVCAVCTQQSTVIKVRFPMRSDEGSDYCALYKEYDLVCTRVCLGELKCVKFLVVLVYRVLVCCGEGEHS